MGKQNELADPTNPIVFLDIKIGEENGKYALLNLLKNKFSTHFCYLVN